MPEKWLFKRIDNSALILFRICFGFLLVAQSWGTLLTGYIKEKISPLQFSFNFIGLDFIQPLPGAWMYLFFFLMGLFGIGVMLGYKYRWSLSLFTLFWAWFYFMHKANYNNHYYLLLLLCVFMLLAPANAYWSLDVKGHPEKTKTHMPQWVRLFILLQLGIVYTYAALAKIYPDWLDGSVARQLLAAKAGTPIIGSFIQQEVLVWIVTYYGIAFDLFIVPLMLWKKTRKWAFINAVFFHLFNSLVFQIGIFPYLALALFLFFFPTQHLQRLFLPHKELYQKAEVIPLKHNRLLYVFLSVWFLLQLALPLRHWFIPGNVLWTEEGHRLSWRMMLRSRSGWSTFKIVDHTSKKEIYINKSDYLSPDQINATATHADMIWQFAQHLKKQYAKENKEIAVYVEAWVSVNGKKPELYIKPEVDLTKVKWNYFGHNPWIMPEKKQFQKPIPKK